MSISALTKWCPSWADVRTVHAYEAQVDAIAMRASGSLTRLFELKVVQRRNQIVVSERHVGSTLPTCCPERHINPDASFCIGLRAGEGIDENNAAAWWSKLHAFILCQETAAETGLWPSEAQLSHGDGGELEIAAERAAEKLGLGSSYRDAVVFNAGPIASSLVKIDPKTGKLRNGRSACLCGQTDGRRKVLRRECHRKGFGCPIVLEYLRRIKVDEFWSVLRGQPCCSTMRECPLKKSA